MRNGFFVEYPRFPWVFHRSTGVRAFCQQCANTIQGLYAKFSSPTRMGDKSRSRVSKFRTAQSKSRSITDFTRLKVRSKADIPDCLAGPTPKAVRAFAEVPGEWW